MYYDYDGDADMWISVFLKCIQGYININITYLVNFIILSPVPAIQMIPTSISPGVKRSGREADHSTAI